jgi:ribosomal protein S18 acetylase RimI-like enzyme
LKLYKDGHTIFEIAKILNVSSGLISNRLSIKKEERIIRSDRNSVLSQSDKDIIIKLYIDNKMSSYDIGGVINKHPEVVRRFLNNIGIVRSKEERRKLAIEKFSNKNHISSLSIAYSKILDSLNIKYEMEFSSNIWLFDFKIVNSNMLVELQGDYWHKLKDRVQKDNKKLKYANNNGFDLRYLWGSDFKNENFIVNTTKYWFGMVKIIDFSFDDLSFKKNDGISLFKSFHCKFKMVDDDITFYIGDIAIASIMYYIVGDSINLEALVIHPEYQKKNLASNLISKFVKIIKKEYPLVKSLFTYVYPNKNHSGTIFKASNWIFDGEERDYWYQSKSKNIISKEYVTNQSIINNINENDYCIDNGLVKVDGYLKLKFKYNL